MNYRMILNIIGKIVCVEAAFMLPALGISLYLGESSAVLGFALSAAIMLAAALPALFLKPRRKYMFARDGFVTVGLTWLLVSAFGALPFFISGAIPNYIDCLFETVSGFTTTGASILADVESVEKGLIYWRSFTHWLGGMGVLVFVLALSPLTAKDSGESMHLLRAESPGVRITKLVPRMRRSATILYAIYIALTLIMLVVLLLGDMPAFDAVCITLGTAGTGGFGVRNDSCASYSPYSQWIITVFMLLFSVNFNIYFLFLLRQFRKAFSNEELRGFALIVTAAIVIIAIDIAGDFSTTEVTVRTAAFHVASVISTSGFATTNYDLWPQLSRTVIVALMLVGACAGSTGGGIKVVRILVMAKSARRAVYKTLHPRAVKLLHMDGELLDDDTVSATSAFLSLYGFLALAVVMIISVDGFDFTTNFTAAIACLSNIGPGLNAVGPAMNYSAFSDLSKLVLTLAMLIGRLEIYPILVLFVPSVWRK